ncbi:hypothetical protein SISNIDRAFT_452784 [Sistotremastrum niveocremeum HHB9708]|uniref:Bromodomain-containing protein n=1 Tax=Sistotremastrum niveocremeum HHB9708 TaxID=1314777 RepID=A0A164W2R5_9AGAM|nr:hypothetical protein SISNIDRAFT_452784 [Sistotremastrum niveocremeum HHB9708]
MPPRMHRTTSATPAPILPVATFRKVEDEATTQHAGVHDQQARSYGYNDPNSDFKRPDTYIRYVEPLESELIGQVEYDMDEQDQAWLDTLNQERRKEQSNQVSYETFEIIMDKIEKDWFELMKKLPKTDAPIPSEDSTCSICDDAEVENSNAIVFCDGCNLAVHQECYGVPYIPEGQWLCRKCQLSPEHPVFCVLCPNEGGAFKQTSTGAWAHLLCAMYISETTVGNAAIQEPIEGVDKIEKARWKLICSLCGKGSGGACIQCAKTQCYTAYHTTCARQYKMLMPMKGAEGERLQLTSYCSKHLPKEQLEAHNAYLQSLEQDSSDGDDPDDGNPESRPLKRNNHHTGVLDTPKSKSARAYSKSYNLGAPLLPAKIVESVMQHISKISILKKSHFVHLVCKYWSLKREARRGAPLLKRLHLEPWTATSLENKQTEEDREIRKGLFMGLRKDLERVRLLADAVIRRETAKQEQAEPIYKLLEKTLLVHQAQLSQAFEKITLHDRNDYFKNPVSRFDVPDYFDIVTNPMCWNQIEVKLDQHEYWDIEAFKHDVNLVLDNAMLYNKKDTTYHKAAAKMKPHVDIILGQLVGSSRSDPALDLGDLEPPLEMLELFTSDSITESMDILTDPDPLTSLFAFEIERPRPKPPPVPKKKAKPKIPKPIRIPRDYAAERARRKERERDDAAKVDEVPDFILPRTRGAAAAQAAFVAEAGVASADGLGSAPLSESVEPDERTAHSREQLVDSPMEVDFPAESMGHVSSKPTRVRVRRDPVVLPGQAIIPPVVDSVDGKKSFDMFDGGWILPPDQRRGGRPPPTETVEPPKKRQRTDRRKSGLSVTATSTQDNETISDAPTSHLAIPEIPEEPESKQEDVTQSHPVRTSKRKRAVKANSGSEMSELSELSEAEEPLAARLEQRSSHTSTPTPIVHPPERLNNAAEPYEHLKVRSDTKLEPGTLVWAKMESYPHWPAVVFEEDDPAVPVVVAKSRPKSLSGNPHLVRFYDRTSSWKWLEPNKLHLLGEDLEFDQKMLAGTVAKQKFKNERLKVLCRVAYAEAAAEIETEEDRKQTIPDGEDSTNPVHPVDGVASDSLDAAPHDTIPRDDIADHVNHLSLS